MPSSKAVHFLIVFDHSESRIVAQEAFSDSDQAVSAYSKTENEFADRPRVEVVLIASDSIETVKRTHANYFDGSVAVHKYLRAVS